MIDARRKAARRRRPHLEPETAQNAAQAHLDVVELRLHQLARGEQCAHLLGSHRLTVHRPEPAQPHQLRQPARVIAVRFHRHRRQRCLHVPRLQKLHRQPALPQRPVQPLRQRACFQPDPLHAHTERFDTGIRATGSLATLHLANDLPALVNHAHVGAIQRHVNSCIMLHGRPSMMLGAAKPDSGQLTPSVEGRPRSNSRALRALGTGPLPHLVSGLNSYGYGYCLFNESSGLGRICPVKIAKRRRSARRGN